MYVIRMADICMVTSYGRKMFNIEYYDITKNYFISNLKFSQGNDTIRFSVL